MTQDTTSVNPYQHWRLITAVTIQADRHSRGLFIAQSTDHPATKKENVMDYGLIIIATNALLAIFIFFILSLIWKR